MLIDSHCHLNFEGLRDRLPEVRQRMREQGVGAAVVICTTMEEFEDVHALAAAHPEMWCTVGVHPDTEGLSEPTEADLVERARRDRVMAIGETGLDYYRLNVRSVADMAWQRERFRTHIRAARAVGKPLVVHTRSASEDTLAILREEGAEAVGGVFHCFTESQAVAEAALAMGFHLSFSGILTFRNAREIQDVARWAPLDRILVETDSPYLAPVPHRGQVNEPAHVVHVARFLATLKGLPEAEVIRATTRNTARLFGLPLSVAA
jgi:TatD DNase family protein